MRQQLDKFKKETSQRQMNQSLPAFEYSNVLYKYIPREKKSCHDKATSIKISPTTMDF